MTVNKIAFRDRLNERIDSSLQDNELVFDPYDTSQFKQTLEHRRDSFTDGILELDVSPKAAALAMKEHGDARKRSKHRTGRSTGRETGHRDCHRRSRRRRRPTSRGEPVRETAPRDDTLYQTHSTRAGTADRRQPGAGGIRNPPDLRTLRRSRCTRRVGAALGGSGVPPAERTVVSRRDRIKPHRWG